MIKITRIPSDAEAITRLRVEGRVTERTAGELANACASGLADGGQLLLDLRGVLYVDPAGAQTIAALSEGRVTPVGGSRLVNALLGAHGPGDAGAADAGDAAGEEPATVEDVVRSQGARLLAVARRMLGDEDAARAAVRDAFGSCLDARGAFADDAPLVLRLRRAVVAAAARRIRSRRRSPEPSVEELMPRFDEDGHRCTAPSRLVLPDDEDARRAAVQRCLDRLPPSIRAVLVLRDVEGLDAAETAAALATTVRNVKHRLHRARTALRTLLERESLGAGEARPPDES